MKTPITKIRRIVAAIAIPALLITAATASAQTQQNNQLALQLGAIQLGYTPAQLQTNATFLGQALIQGQKALLATASNSYSAYVVTNNAPSTNQPVAQSASFRAELYQATLNALNSPVTETNKFLGVNAIPVVTYNPHTGRLTTNKITNFNLNPVLTTPSAVMAIVNARIPDLDPGLISNAVAASMEIASTNTNGVLFPVWGPQPAAASVKTATNAQKLLTLNTTTAKRQLNNASAVAKASLIAAVKAYAAGTKQWAKVPTTGPATNGVYLPNFGAKNLGPTLNPQVANIDGLQNAAAAVAANAINGLGAINTNTTITNSVELYGKSATNVTSIAKSLAAAAASFQATSTKTVNGVVPNYGGAEAAAAFGMVTQVSGTNSTDIQSSWSAAETKAVLNGVVIGAVSGSRANAITIAYGVAEGFTAAYLQTYKNVNGNITGAINAAAFKTLNESSILNTFIGIKGLVTTKNNTAFTTAIDLAFSNVYTAFTANTTASYSALTGANGINLGNTNVPSLINGVGTPVTDTIGL